MKRESDKGERGGFSRLGKAPVVVSTVCGVLLLALSVAGCGSPSAAANGTSEDVGAVETTTAIEVSGWSAGSDCIMCHVQEMEASTDSECIGSLHASVTCMTCHVDEAALTTVHADVSTTEDPEKSKLWKTSVDESICLYCHGSYEELAEKTTGVTALTDANGTVVNPHAMPDLESHVDISCSSCHKIHDDVAAVDEAHRLCISCHHMEVWECGTCHEYSSE